jgi:hypothetical protein
MHGNRLLFIAGLLAAFTAAVHTFVGTYEVHGPLLGSALPKPLALLLYACWHLVTVVLCLSAWQLLSPPKPRPTQCQAVLAGAFGLMWLLFGLVFMAVAFLFGGGVSALLVLPQWALLLPVGALAWFGSRRLLAAPV